MRAISDEVLPRDLKIDPEGDVFYDLDQIAPPWSRSFKIAQDLDHHKALAKTLSTLICAGQDGVTKAYVLYDNTWSYPPNRRMLEAWRRRGGLEGKHRTHPGYEFNSGEAKRLERLIKYTIDFSWTTLIVRQGIWIHIDDDFLFMVFVETGFDPSQFWQAFKGLGLRELFKGDSWTSEGHEIA